LISCYKFFNIGLIIIREESMQKMLIIKEKEKAQRKQLQSEIDAAECRLQKIMERNAINKKKLHNMW